MPFPLLNSTVQFSTRLLEPQVHRTDPYFSRDVFNPEPTEHKVAFPRGHHTLRTGRDLYLASIGVPRNVDAHSLSRVIHPKTTTGQLPWRQNLLERATVVEYDLASSRILSRRLANRPDRRSEAAAARGRSRRRLHRWSSL